jgi:hypothetical protein
VQEEGKKFVELNHEFSAFGPLLAEAFSEAKFVHLVRHPKSVVSSFMRKFSPPPMELPAFMGTRRSLLGQYVLRYNRFRNLSKLGPSFVQRFVESYRFDTHLHPFEKVNGKWEENKNMNSFHKTCWYWNEINKLILQCLKDVPQEKKIKIHFEEIFDEESKEVKKIFLDFFEITDLNVEDMVRFCKVKVNIKQVHTSFPSAANWDEDMLNTLATHCGSTMKQLGCFSDFDL